MRYDFECFKCERVKGVQSAPFHPPEAPHCCGQLMRRMFGCEMDTASCKDADDIPVSSRVTQNTAYGNTEAEGRRIEAAYAKDIAAKRSALRGMRNSTKFRMQHSIPTELYHGKIKQTGDRNYWQQKKNLDKHKSCKVG